MTDEPTPDELAAQGAKVNRGLELALRWVASLAAANHNACAQARTLTAREGVGQYVVDSLAFMALDFGRQLFGVEGFQRWCDQQLAAHLDYQQRLREE